VDGLLLLGLARSKYSPFPEGHEHLKQKKLQNLPYFESSDDFKGFFFVLRAFFILKAFFLI
jgi:hypothetical protein